MEPDYSSMSDEELMAIANAPDNTAPAQSEPDYNSMSDAELMKLAGVTRKDTILKKLQKPETKYDTFKRAYGDVLGGAVDAISSVVPQSVQDKTAGLRAGLMDAPVAAGELVGAGLNAVGVDTGMADASRSREANIAAERAARGDTGLDLGRLTGNVVNPLTWAAGSELMGAKVLSKAPAAVKGAVTGLGLSELTPTGGKEGGDFVAEKGLQGATGAIGGAVIPTVGGAIGKLISPEASKNAELKMLKEGGVKPTIGQALGGAFNTMEEKLQVIPFIGDMISKSRGMARDEFNKMVINEVTAPIGKKVSKIGSEGVAEAGDVISQHYENVLKDIKGVKFDQEFADNLSNLKTMSEYMEPKDATRFDRVLQDVVGTKMSPAGGMEAQTYKQVDSRIGKMASNNAGTEFGDALRELQSLLREQLTRSNPEKAADLEAANAAWAKLVRLENASKAASSHEGVFTPAQLMSAVKTADKSTRKRAVARGEALMQDTATAGQKILGNKYPDSGTAGRLLAAGGIGAAGVLNPLVAAGVGAGSAIYTRPVQNALVKLIAERPDLAPQIQAELNALASQGGRLSPLASGLRDK